MNTTLRERKDDERRRYRHALLSSEAKRALFATVFYALDVYLIHNPTQHLNVNRIKNDILTLNFDAFTKGDWWIIASALNPIKTREMIAAGFYIVALDGWLDCVQNGDAKINDN